MFIFYADEERGSAVSEPKFMMILAAVGAVAS
jgi:hypothetical protein